MILNYIRNYISSNFFIKFISFIIILLVIKIPLNTWVEYIIISIFILGCFFGKIIIKKRIFYSIISVLLILNLIKIFLPTNIIMEKYAIYTPPYYVADYKDPAIPKIIDTVGLERLTKENSLFLNQEKPRKWAFFADSFWSKDPYVKKINNLNFNNRFELNLGELNDFSYYSSGTYDLYYPMIFSYKFNQIVADQLCWKGLLFFPTQNQDYVLKERKDFSCEKLEKLDLVGKVIFALDISENSQLSIKLIHNNFFDKIMLNFNFIEYLILLIFTFLLFKFSFGTLLSLFVSNLFYFIYLYELVLKGLPSKFSELVYLQRGNDGITHFRMGRDILENIYNKNILMALRGDSDVYYFMPGMRYVNSLFMTFFGDTSLGYLLITAFIPFIIAMCLRKLVNKNWSIILFWCFMIFPIFESFGFLQFYYSKLSILGFGESLGYFFLFLSFLIIITKKNEPFYNKNFKTYFIFGLLCFGVIALRPNYIIQIASFLFLLFLMSFIFVKSKMIFNDGKLIKFILILIGFSPIFLILLHNWYFGQKFILLTEASTIKENLRVPPSFLIFTIYEFFKFNIIYENWSIIFNNLKTWINYYEIWLILIYANLWVGLLRKNNAFIFRIICFSLICSHFTYVFYAGDHRYTYGLWTLCLLIFFRDIGEFYYPNYLIQKIKKLNLKNNFNNSIYYFFDPIKKVS